MIFQKIKLLNFKNFQELSIDLSSGFHFVTGKNGAGKTNFLDAVYYFCMLRSFRKTKDIELVNHQENYFRTETIISDLNSNHTLSIKFKPGILKEVIWDELKDDRLSAHLGRIPVVLIAPDEIYQFIHESEERRKFINQTLIQIDSAYFDNLNTYSRLLKQRNAAIKLMKKQGKMDSSLLDAYDTQLAGPGIAIANKRAELIVKLKPVLNEYSLRISGKDEQLDLKYKTNVEHNYLEALYKSRELDFYTGGTNLGIHKDKLECIMNKRSLVQVGSQGQIKTFVLAMKLAQFDFLRKQSQKMPVVLLDDIFAKLDAERVQKLLLLLESEKIEQCFITDTHTERVKELAKTMSAKTAYYEIIHNQFYRHA